MKNIDLGQAITILANVGVIAGIVLLAYELNQNNQLMQVEARASSNERVEGLIEQIYSVPGLAEISLKAQAGDSLTEAEHLKLRGFHMRAMSGWTAAFREFQEGNIEALPPPEVWKRLFDGEMFGSSMRDTWEEMKWVYPPDFVRFMEENVVNER